MSKPFKSIDEQIEILKNRGLILDNEDLVKKQLLTNTYYNTVNSYGYLLRDKSVNDKFIPNATFRELFSLYIFDKDMKDVLFTFIMTIESQFKSVLSYSFSESHPEDYSYLYSSNYKHATDQINDSVNLTNALSKIIRLNREKEPIKHYCDKHDNVPLWVLIKKMDFGTAHRMYRCMTVSDQNSVAKFLGGIASDNYDKNYRLTPEQLENYMLLLKDLRNVVAHSDRLLGFNSRHSVVFHDNLHKEFGYINKQQNRSNVYDIYVICKLFLTDKQFDRFTRSLAKKFNLLEKKLSSIDINVLTKELGFPKDWHKNKN